MYQNDLNEYGCPLRGQTGSVGVQNFDAIITQLAPELRAAFETERAACQAELDRYFAADTAMSASLEPDLSIGADLLTTGYMLITQFQQWLGKLGRPRLRELIESLLPPVAAQN